MKAHTRQQLESCDSSVRPKTDYEPLGIDDVLAAFLVLAMGSALALLYLVAVERYGKLPLATIG